MPYTETNWQDGQTKLGPTNLNKLENGVSSGYTTFNVKDSAYGAKGDGTTDDTVAIMAAISDASSSGAGHVHLPAGTYLLGQQQTSPVAFIDDPNLLIENVSNVRIVGDPGAKIKAKTGANFSANLLFYNCTNIEVAGIEFVGNNTGLSGGQNNGAIALESVVGAYIHDCTISGYQGSHIVGDWIFNAVFDRVKVTLSVSGSTVFDLYWIQDFTVRDCDLRGGSVASTTGFQNEYDAVASGSNVTSETLLNSVSNNIRLVRNRISGFQTGINIADAVDCIVEDNNIHDNYSATAQNYWGVLIQSSTATKPTSNIKVVNNRLYGNGSGSGVANTGAAVAVSTNSNSSIIFTLEDNDIFDNQADGVMLGSSGITLYARRNRFFSRNNSNQTSTIANFGFLASTASRVKDNDGFNPQAWSTSTPVLPGGTGSGNKVTNTNPYPVTVYLNGGTGIHVISAAGTDIAISGGAQNVLTLQPQDAIYFATSNTSGWAWYGI